VGILEWILILELLLLLSAGICYLAGHYGSSMGLSDPLLGPASKFWEVFLARFPQRHELPDYLRRWIADRQAAAEAADAAEALAQSDDSAAADLARLSPDAEAAEQPAQQAGFDQAVTLSVRVLANAPMDRVMGRSGDALEVHVTADAEQGAANKAVIDLLAQTLHVKTYQIQLIRGHYRPVKTIKITGVRPSEVDQRLSAAM
jgi:uncharacterized protein